MELQAQTGMTIRGLGDREQCQTIEAGDSIALLQRAIPREAQPQLLSTVRQKTDDLKRIASMFRNKDDMTAEARAGEVMQALDLKRQAGTARLLGGDQDEVNRQTADFFLRRRDALEAAGATKSVSCSALTNAAAAEISGEIRKTLRQRGEIVGDERLYQAIDQRGEIYDLPIAMGDRLRLFQRTGARFDGKFGWLGNNGSMVTVEAITETGLRLRNRHGDAGDVSWDRLMHQRSGRLLVASGWAQTVDSIQGITSAEHINALTHGTSGLTAFRNYPAESRAEWETWTLIGEAGLFETVRHARAIGDQSEITTEHLWKQAAKDMAYAPRKPLGLDLLETVRRDVDAATEQWMKVEHRVHSQKAS
ncbi:conjugal transfer protein TraA, partial [Paeniroseomonas aquatica]|nr:conjugal transfer protein TraA [Paeniroseomonas aquatica]